MAGYMLADMRRIVHQKMRVIWVGLVLLLIVGIAFLFQSMKMLDTYLFFGRLYMGALPMLLGITLFNALFADDFRYKTLQQIIGRGISRRAYIFVKVFECLLISVFYAICVFWVYYLSCTLVDIPFDASMVQETIVALAQAVVSMLFFTSVSMIFVINFQNITTGIVFYVMMATGIIETLLSMILSFEFVSKIIGDGVPFLFNNTLVRFSTKIVNGQFDILALIVLIAYLVVPVLISWLFFSKEELNF